eukprot:4602835-Alexandrium_andersonii.AAC.1
MSPWMKPSRLHAPHTSDEAALGMAASGQAHLLHRFALRPLHARVPGAVPCEPLGEGRASALIRQLA